MTSNDDLDLAALADREGASALLDAVDVGGKVGLTALAALPMTDDAPVAYRRLAQLLLLTKGEDRLHVMRAVYNIAMQPRIHGESIDEGGANECAQVLLRIAQDANAVTAHRALAVSTLRLPAFAFRVVPTQIPTALDVPSGAATAAP